MLGQTYATTPPAGDGDDGWTRAVDLATQLEDLLHAVWLGEENWRFDDRLELALRSWRDGDRAS
jgi:hypothetical protein